MHTKTVLVVGGAGFIGSHMVLFLKEQGYRVLVFDNLSTGHRDAVANTDFIEGDMTDQAALDTLFKSYSISAVMHFAGLIDVGDSVRNPKNYYHHNLLGTYHLLNAMRKADVKNLIFSSTAAVYGEPVDTPITESHPTQPLNPYGQTKRMIEIMLSDYHYAYGLNFISLRYFNAAGADLEGRLQERHQPETHLIPLILQVAQGVLPHIKIYGNDYPTPDGTCIRDYIHVTDICSAHALALEALFFGTKQAFYNLGTGQGYSVQQVIDMARLVTGMDIPIVYDQRRLGDPAILIADPANAMHELSWQPRYSDLQTIIKSVWDKLSTDSVDNSVNIR